MRISVSGVRSALASCVAIGLAVAGCSSPSSAPRNIRVDNWTVSPATIQLAVGDTVPVHVFFFVAGDSVLGDGHTTGVVGTAYSDSVSCNMPIGYRTIFNHCRDSTARSGVVVAARATGIGENATFAIQGFAPGIDTLWFVYGTIGYYGDWTDLLPARTVRITVH